jgi:hypothetical protein
MAANQWNSLAQATKQQNTVLGFKAACDGTAQSYPGLPGNYEFTLSRLNHLSNEQPLVVKYLFYIITL